MNQTSAYLERMNWANDRRTQGEAKTPTLCLYDEATDTETEIDLPLRWEVCPVCEGRGEHVNPSIDAGGLSAEDLSDPDFREDYMNGVFNIPCNHCGGRTTVQVVDRDRCDPEHLKAYDEQQRADAEYAALCRAEFIAGA